MLLRNATWGEGGGMIAYDILGCGIGGFLGVLFLRAAGVTCVSNVSECAFLGLVKDEMGAAGLAAGRTMMIHVCFFPGDIHVRISTCYPYLCSCVHVVCTHMQ